MAIEINEQQYIDWFEMLTAGLRTINTVPIASMVDFNERAQTLAPLLEPTAFMRGGGKNLHDQRLILDAALALQRVCEKVAGVKS